MDHIRALPLLVLLGSTAFSQTTGNQTPPVTVLKEFSSAALQANCPIQLKAILYVVGGMAGAEPIENGRTTGRDRRIYIVAANPESEVAFMRLTIYGFPVGIRAGVDPAVALRSHEGSVVLHNNPEEIHRMLSIGRTLQTGQSTWIDVSVQDFSTVSSVDLSSVNYSNGSSWHLADDKFCQAVLIPVPALRIDGIFHP